MVPSLARFATPASPKVISWVLYDWECIVLSSDADSSSDYELANIAVIIVWFQWWNFSAMHQARPWDWDSAEQATHEGEVHSVNFTTQSSLEMLVSWCACPECGSHEVTPKWSRSGKQLTIRLSCKTCDNTSRWQSQPTLRAVAAGNILLSAGIPFRWCFSRQSAASTGQHWGSYPYITLNPDGSSSSICLSWNKTNIYNLLIQYVSNELFDTAHAIKLKRLIFFGPFEPAA